MMMMMMLKNGSASFFDTIGRPLSYMFELFAFEVTNFNSWIHGS